MKEKLRRSRRFELVIAATVTALIAAAPAAALAAGESSASGEAAAESPSGQTESHSESTPSTETTSPSSGWVPQGEGTEASGHEATGARRGSSLGSSGSGSNSGSTSEEPSQTTGSSGYDEQPTSSSGYYEHPESSTPPAAPEPPSTPQVSSGGASTEPSAPKAPARNRGSAAVGAALAVARSESPPIADIGDAPAATIARLASSHDQAAPGIGTLQLLFLIVCGFILLYAGGRLVLGPVEPEIPSFLRSGARRLR